ncbi:hypothetical protein E2C01_022265 [Portunus trituberculatus]|uniref:Uncharacterized protein n=1 Tax=Portunus trituberculatus TaxID=210409 RepID=A0A5B7E5J1_PORTR|nr:hypothetical protein [Portunus trituberculatus]
MNINVSVIGEGHTGFIFCIANLRLPYRANWTDPDDTPLPNYTPPDPRNTGVGVSGGVVIIYT